MGPRRRPTTPPRAPAAISRAGTWIPVALALLAVAVYTPVWRFDFVTLDDPLYVTGNPVVAAGLTWTGIQWAFASAYAANWHPLTWISHMADVQAFGLEPGGHHLTSLALHLANTVLLFALLRRMTGAAGRSAVVAAFFAVHPLHVESVAWIAERKDVLSTCFGLMTMWAYAGYARTPEWRRYSAVLGLFACSLMAKPMLVTLPFVLLLLDVWPLDRLGTGRTAWRTLVLEKVPLLALSAMSSVITVVAQSYGGAVRSGEAVPVSLRIANAASAVMSYLTGTVWPSGLAVFYPLPASVPIGTVIASAMVILGVSLIAMRWRRRAPYVAVGWFWFLGMLVPVIGLVQVGGQAHADRYTYLPIVGLFIAMAWGGHDLLSRVVPRRAGRALEIAGATVAIVALSVAAHRQVQFWRDGFTLWQRAADVVPDNYRADASLGVMLAERGRSAEAIPHLRAAVGREPDLTEVHRILARLLMGTGEYREAVQHFAEVVRLSPEDGVARSQLGLALVSDGRRVEGLAALAEGVRLAPANAEVHNNLGSTLALQGQLVEALPHFAEAVRLKPDFEQAHFNLALALAKLGRFPEAAAEFTAVLRLNPRNDQARQALESLRR